MFLDFIGLIVISFSGNPANLVYFVHIALCVLTACMGHVFGVVVMAISQKFEVLIQLASLYHFVWADLVYVKCAWCG